MNKLLSEALKIDIALTSQSLTGAGTGQYYSMSKYRRALFIAEIGAMVAAATSVLQVWESPLASGVGAQALTGLTATITANTNVAEVTLTLVSVVALDAVTINGLVFTAHTDTTTPANREFSVAGSDTQDAAELVICINDPVYGVPGVTASNAAGVVTLVATEPGEVTITITLPAATITPATLRAIGYVEVEDSMLTQVGSFTHLALTITNSGAMQTGAVLVRGNARYSPIQHVAAADFAP